MRDKIVVAGASIVDILVQGASEEAFHTGSWPAENIRMSLGGDALNEATVLGRLGAPVRLETLLCDDEGGHLIKRHCEANHIVTGGYDSRRDVPTGINVVLVEKNGERSFLTNPRGSLRQFGPEHISLPFPEDAKILSFASIFVFPRFGAEELAAVFRAAKEQGMTVCADVTKCKHGEKVKDLREALAWVDYIFPNYEEAALVTGKRELPEIAGEFLAAGVKNVVIKCGRDGCFLCSQERSLQIPAVSGVRCLDTTGAGDCFAAGFLYGLWRDYPLERCAQIANACGALAVQSLGATEGIRDRSQLEALL